MTLSERIQTILDETGAESVALGKAAGVTKGTVSQWLSGQIKSIKLEYAVGIQEAYGYSAVWVVMGKGPKKATSHDNVDGAPIPILQSSFRKLPVKGHAQLGDNGHFCEIEYPVGHGDGYVQFFSSDPDAYALRCVGDSMEPRIHDGEFVVVAPNHPVQNGDEVLVCAKDDRVMIKTIAYKRDGFAHLLSVNKAHSTIKIPLPEIEKIHFIEAIVKPSAWRPD